MASSRYDDYKIGNDYSAFNGFQGLPYDEWDQDPAQTKQDFDEAVGKGVQAPHDAFVQAVAEDMDKAPIKNDYELLWSGSFASGTIAVPNLLNYRLYHVRFAGSDYGGLMVRGNGYITGGVIANPAPPQIYHVTMTHSGNDVTLQAAQSVLYPIGSGSSVGGDLTITDIYGVI